MALDYFYVEFVRERMEKAWVWISICTGRVPALFHQVDRGGVYPNVPFWVIQFQRQHDTP